MSQPNPAMTSTVAARNAPPAWMEELVQMLAKAAQLAAANGVDGESFKRVAWNAFLDARPGLRQQLEDKHLKAHLRKLRKRGLIASA